MYTYMYFINVVSKLQRSRLTTNKFLTSFSCNSLYKKGGGGGDQALRSSPPPSIGLVPMYLKIRLVYSAVNT